MGIQIKFKKLILITNLMKMKIDISLSSCLGISIFFFQKKISIDFKWKLIFLKFFPNFFFFFRKKI